MEKTVTFRDVNQDQDQDNDTSHRTVGPYPYLFGAVASLGGVGFYMGLITLTSDRSNAWMQFAEYRMWILSLAAGLGVQVALFSFLRRRLQTRNMKAAKSGLAVSGGMSTASMAVCCAHYLAAFLPLLGLSFLSPLAASLVEYQKEFFLLGLLSNLMGIGIMLRLMEKHGVIQMRTWVNHFNFGLSRP